MTMNKVIVNLLLRKPYFGYILASLKTERSNSVKRMDCIIGPSVRLIYNPEWFSELNEDHAFGAIIHELLHLVLLHPIRGKYKKTTLWNIACDIAVNEHISYKLLPDGYITLDVVNREISPKLESGKSAEYYYECLVNLDENQSLNLSYREDDIVIHSSDDEDFLVIAQDQSECTEINSKAFQCSMEDITKQAAEEGEISGKLMSSVQGLYKSVDVNWRNILKKYFAGKGRMVTHKTVKRVSKRFDDMPGNKRHKGLRALVAIDESGSISDEDILTFYNELRVIKRITKANIEITRFDTECTNPIQLEQYLKIKDRIKQGGTDFRSIFKLADKIGVRIVVVFTDGDGIFPKEIKQKVLWVKIGENKKEFPFGDVVQFSG